MEEKNSKITTKQWIKVNLLAIFIIGIFYLRYGSIPSEIGGLTLLFIGILPLILYLYFERNTRVNFFWLILFFIVREFISSILRGLYIRSNFSYKIAFIYILIYHGSTFYPFYRYFQMNKFKTSLKNSLILGVQKFHMLYCFSFILTKIQEYFIKKESFGLMYLLLLTFSFLMVEKNKYSLWKEAVNKKAEKV